MDFGYKITKKDHYSLVKLNGNLIEKNQANNLMEEIDAHPEGEQLNFVIDLSSFQYMNSTGLNILLNILSKARKSGGEAVICAVPEKINSLLVITKLNNVFSVLENEESAAKTFAN
ncbi:MAG: STAS domain-containing protein [Bacteroidota bacterium]